MNINPWLRQVEVEVLGIPEWDNPPGFTGPPAPSILKVYSDGTQDTLRVKFSISKQLYNINQPSSIIIYNLGRSLRNAIRQRGAQVIVRTNWLMGNEGKLQQIYIGALAGAWSHRQGPDIITELGCVSTTSASRTTVPEQFATVSAGTPIKDVVIGLAKAMGDITIDPLLIDVGDDVVGKGGMSFIGSIQDCLDSLARAKGFSWSIIDKVFEASYDNYDQVRPFRGATIDINSRNGFLKRAEPILASPLQFQRGITIQSLLHPLVQPRRIVNLESEINPPLTGSYMITSVNHTGDTGSDMWDTRMDSILYDATKDNILSTLYPSVKKIDTAGENFTQKWEGFRSTKYPDGNGYSIGYGHHLTPQEEVTNSIMIDGVKVNISGGITQEQGKALFKQDMSKVEKTLNQSIKVPLTQNQYDALADIGYNTGAPGTVSSSIMRAVNSGQLDKVPNLIRNYKITSEGVVLQGLIDRRAATAKLWVS